MFVLYNLILCYRTQSNFERKSLFVYVGFYVTKSYIHMNNIVLIKIPIPVMIYYYVIEIYYTIFDENCIRV